MAEENIDKIPATSCSIPGEDPPPPPAEEGGDKPNKSDFDAARQPKRRKNCPASLDQLEAIKLSSLNSSFSFTFDCNFVSTPESTPRFGSFNSAAMPELERCRQVPATSKGKAEEEDSKSETSEEAKEIEGSADASESAVD